MEEIGRIRRNKKMSPMRRQKGAVAAAERRRRCRKTRLDSPPSHPSFGQRPTSPRCLRCCSVRVELAEETALRTRGRVNGQARRLLDFYHTRRARSAAQITTLDRHDSGVFVSLTTQNRATSPGTATCNLWDRPRVASSSDNPRGQNSFGCRTPDLASFEISALPWGPTCSACCAFDAWPSMLPSIVFYV